ncbi:MAG TPA: VOC family protein [Pseudonocardiaceae bacterium]|nr:VOC family protein [Pseudonocardiaceae bacterium]
MTEHRDPLDVLRTGVVPTEPDPAFAARLRARLESEVLNPKGATMSSSEPTSVTLEQTPTREGDVVYSSLWVPDVDRAQAFYTAVLGWRIDASGETRRVLDVRPPMGMRGGTAHGTLFLCHAVDDLAAALDRVRAAGGEAGEPVREPFGLVADCVDNQGMRFAMLHAPRDQRQPVPPPGAGELFYLTVRVPNSQLYRDFYGTVFGWTFTPGRIEDGWGVTGPAPMTGMHGNVDRPSVVPMFGVADVAAAVAAVRAAGGTAEDPVRMPYGTTADCVDDQGLPFYLGQV